MFTLHPFVQLSFWLADMLLFDGTHWADLQASKLETSKVKVNKTSLTHFDIENENTTRKWLISFFYILWDLSVEYLHVEKNKKQKLGVKIGSTH